MGWTSRFRSSKASTETNQKEQHKPDERRGSKGANVRADVENSRGSSRPDNGSSMSTQSSSRSDNTSSRGGGGGGVNTMVSSSSTSIPRDKPRHTIPPRPSMMVPSSKPPITNRSSIPHHDNSSDGDLPKLLRDLPSYSFTSNSDSVSISRLGSTESNSIHFINSCTTSTTSINSLPEAFRGTSTPNQSFTSSSLTHSTGSCWEHHIANNILKHNNNKNNMVIRIEGSVHLVSEDRCRDQQQEIRTPEADAQAIAASICVISRINTLVSSLGSDHVEIRRNALTELRLLAKHDDDRREAIFQAGAVDLLVELLYSDDAISQQEATTTLVNLSLNQRIKTGIIEAGAIEPLVRVIHIGLTATSMEHATIALVYLVGKDDVLKARVGALNAIPALIELLHNGSERGQKDSATALFILSSLEENKRRMVRGGVTKLLLDFISDEGVREDMVGKSIAILKNLVSIEEGRVAFVEEGGLKFLLGLIQDGNKKSQELGLLILYQLCKHSSKHASLVLKMDPTPCLLTIDKNTTHPRLKAQVLEVLHVLEEHKKTLDKQLNKSRHS